MIFLLPLSRPLCLCAGACLLSMAIIGSARAQGSAAGVLTIGKDKFELKHAAAALVPDSAEKGKTKTRIVLTDQPVAPDLLDDGGQIWDLKSKGFHGLEVEITSDKANYSLFVISATLDGSLSSSGTFDGRRLTVFTNKRVEGSLEAAPEEHGGTTFGYSVKFAADVVPPDPAPSAADASAAAAKDSTKAYLALVAAIRSGNKQKILELSPPDRRAAIDTPEFPQMLKMVQDMMPQNIQVLKAVETGDHARLLARGSAEGKSQRGKIYLDKVNGRWIMVSESWGAE